MGSTSSKTYSALPNGSEPTQIRRLQRNVHILAAGLAVQAVISFVLAVVIIARSTILPTPSESMIPSLALVPQFQRFPVRFEKTLLYGGPPSNESDAAWRALSTANDGFIAIEETVAREHGLRPGLKNQRGDGTQDYDLSMFHQLHCLDTIRHGYYAASGNKSDHSILHNHKHLNRHIGHCFDYLRQGIQCAGDLALEWASPSGGAVVGWGVSHQCVNYEQVLQWVEKNSAESLKKASNRHQY